MRNARLWPYATMLEKLCKRIQHCCATLRRSRTSSWELLTQKFDRFHTLCNNSQQHATASNNGNWVCKRTTMLGGFGRQCCVRLHRASETETFIMIATRSFNIFLLCMLWPNITPHTSCKMIKLGKECYLWTPSNFNNLKHLYLFILNLFFFNFQSWENKQKMELITYFPTCLIHTFVVMTSSFSSY